MVFGTHDRRKGWINRLAVRPGYRRQGVARRLIEACEQALYAQGIGITAALIERDNAVSVDLFTDAGYVADVPVHYFVKAHPAGDLRAQRLKPIAKPYRDRNGARGQAEPRAWAIRAAHVSNQSRAREQSEPRASASGLRVAKRCSAPSRSRL